MATSPINLTCHGDSCCFFQKSWPEKLNTEHLKKKKIPLAKLAFHTGKTPSTVANIPGAPYLSDFAITPKLNKLPKSYKLLISWLESSNCSIGFAFPAHMLVSSIDNSCACKFALQLGNASISGLASAL